VKLVRNVASGALAGAIGTAAMDRVLYARPRRDDGKDPRLALGGAAVSASFAALERAIAASAS